ncbi:histidine phosphatase family protein [Catenuloplanes atrovinosus]|uniref:Phosphoglycerate mutase n=1 Tax=Catenuloplanes atrovinosus TaxID=137266 RepID=A0AAE3YS43_9ACTN|nr:histidine phosphatase family protein [Catenuloplanes atrovinosus]MDR7278630.1 putative phosphoglycerate mutase [Catenuloplanes atrovinosus]
MTRLIIWRHGNTDWNAAGRVQGQTDVPLNDLGRSQAATAARLIAGLEPSAIYSSDLLRARHTADALATLVKLPVTEDPRLRERHYGLFQGLTDPEIAEAHPEAFARWRGGDPDVGAEVERNDDVGKRVGESLREIAERHPGEVVVVATHGGAARQGFGDVLGWPSDVMSAIRPLQNCHWTELVDTPNRGWQLRAHNVGPWPEKAIPAPV